MRASKRRRNHPDQAIPGSKRYLVGGRRVAVLGRGSSLALNLDLTLGVLPASIAFSHAGQAMLTDATGNLTYAPNNLLVQSNNFSNAAWTQGNLASVVQGAADPFGGNTAWTLTDNATSGEHRIYQTISVSGNVVLNLYAKAGSAGFISLTYQGNASTYATFNLNTGAVTSSIGVWWPSITPVSGSTGWYAISIVYVGTLSGFFVINMGTTAANAVPVVGYVGSGSTIIIANASKSSITYETTPRPGDQVVTGAAAYYGARFDRDPITHAAQGLLVEGVATNLYLNSQAPALQNLTVTNQVYTVSAYGVGTMVLSGTGSGTLTGTGANTLVSLTFTPTAGTLTLTPSGSLTYVQVETGSAPSSRIVTAAASVTRAADVVSLTPAAFQRAVNVMQGTMFVDAMLPSGVAAGGYPVIMAITGSSTEVGVFVSFPANNMFGQVTAGGNFSTGTLMAYTALVPFRLGFSYGNNTTKYSANGSAIATLANQATGLTSLMLGSDGNSSHTLPAGWFRRLAIYKTALASGQFQARSNIGAPLL